MNSSTYLGPLAEQLCRIEHKLDLILRQQAETNPSTSLLALGSLEHLCPICLQNPTHSINIFNGHVVRTCSCATGKIPLNLAFVAGIPQQQGTEDDGSE